MKALLVGDMPEKCRDCSFLYHGVTTTYNCDISCGKYIENTDVRPDWCPLRPLPDERYEENFDWGHLTQKENAAMNHGWNKCLKAITGEDKN